MKKQIIISAILAAGMANAQMFAQMFSTVGTPIPAVAWYRLDGNALDSSGNGYNGTWSANEAYSGGAASFSGSAYIAIPVPNQTGEWTISLWTTKGNTSDAYPIGDATAAAAQGWALINLDNSASGRIRFRNTSFSSTNVTVTSWNGRLAHIAVTCTGASNPKLIRIYENGNLILTQSRASSPSGVSSFAIGGFGVYTAALRYTGTIDDVRVFARPLSAANIQRIMTGQTVEPIEELQ